MNEFKKFSDLIHLIGKSIKTKDKVSALSDFFLEADGKDKIWLIALFTHRKPKRIISNVILSKWCCDFSNIPEWLFKECYSSTGDMAETIALLLPDYSESDRFLNSLSFYLEKMIFLENRSDDVKKEFICEQWMKMNRAERFVFNKLLTGNFRIGVSQSTIIHALSNTYNISKSVLAHRLMGKWDPFTFTFTDLISSNPEEADISKPYPFFLSSPISRNPESLEHLHEWQAEWKWDGIRGQIIKRNNEFFVWSRGEELISEKFPEYNEFASLLPNGTVLDGEIIPILNGKVLSFSLMQTRISRKRLSKQILLKAPISFIAFDILEWEGNDIRDRTLIYRREILRNLIKAISKTTLIFSEEIQFSTWKHLSSLREISRSNGTEGIMLKKKDSTYQTGRKVGSWWKWKIDPLTIDAVLVYAQKGHGRRSNLYSDYTFAVKDGDKLVTFAKAYSGLNDIEIARVDSFIKKNLLEKFGPVRTVKPELIFEIAFEGIAESKRHKSGIALRFPRISRWREDKRLSDINTLDDLKDMLDKFGT